jgi:hypothetical protein
VRRGRRRGHARGPRHALRRPAGPFQATPTHRRGRRDPRTPATNQVQRRLLVEQLS